MPGLVPGIHGVASRTVSKDVDGRDNPAHDATRSENDHGGYHKLLCFPATVSAPG